MENHDIHFIYSRDGTLIKGDTTLNFKKAFLNDCLYHLDDKLFLRQRHNTPQTIEFVFKDISPLEESLMLAYKDSLTGYYSKNYLHLYLNRIAQDNLDYTFIFGDIDNFKELNTTLGHFGADDVLRRLSSTILNSVFEDDVVFRFGGDEVLIISQNTNLAQQKEKYEKINNQLSDKLGVTCSFGIIVYDKAYSLKDNLTKVDHLLAISKKEGKKMITIGENYEH